MVRMIVYFFLGAIVHSWWSIKLSPLTFGLMPHLLLVLTVLISITQGRVSGQLIGFFWGLYLDVLGVRLMGANCLLFTIIGNIAGNLRRHMDVYNPASLGAIVSVFTLAYHLAWGVLALVFLKEMLLPQWLLFVLQPVLNAILAPMLMIMMRPSRTHGGAFV